MAYRQVILRKGIPFPITIPSEPKTFETLTKNLMKLWKQDFARLNQGKVCLLMPHLTVLWRNLDEIDIKEM